MGISCCVMPCYSCYQGSINSCFEMEKGSGGNCLKKLLMDCCLNCCFCMCLSKVKTGKNDGKCKFEVEKFSGENWISEMKKEIKTGDIMFFGSENSSFSKLISILDDSNTSHCLFVYEDEKEKEWYVCESVIDDEDDGVRVEKFDARMKQINKDHEWLLHLSEDNRKKVSKFTDEINQFMKDNENAEYDMANNIRLIGRKILKNMKDEMKVKYFLELNDFKYFNCSELVSAILRECGIFPEDLNCSNCVPSALASAKIYEENYFQFWGKKHRFLDEYNSWEVEKFKKEVNNNPV